MSDPVKSDSEKSVTIRAAILAFTAAILGAVIGGLGTYVAAKAQIDGQAKQSQADFLRGQREQAYADYAQKVGNCNTALGNYSSTIKVGISTNAVKLPSVPRSINNCLEVAGAAEVNVELVGSHDVTIDMSSIRNALNGYWYDLTNAVSRYNSQSKPTEVLNIFDNTTRHDVSSVAAAQRNFFHDAMHDIQK